MTRILREEGAQAIVLIALSMSVLLLGVGIAIDTGQLYAGRRAVQNAADSAAWAGAVVIQTAGSANGFTAATRTAAESAAIADALRNGYTITTSDVNTPPTSGTFREDPGFVEVNITADVSTTFFPGPRSVTVRAVAGATRSGAGNAVHILNGGNVAATLDLTGAGRLDVTGGDIRVNSTASASIRIASGGITTGTQATRAAGSPGISAGDAGQVVPAVVPNQPAVADPFVTLPGPTTTALWGAAYGTAPAVLIEQGAIDRNNNNNPLVPGIYTGGIRIRGTSNVTMQPGIYVIRGGSGGTDYGFTVEGSAQVNMASATAGVLIFNTYSTFPATPGTTSCGQIDINTTGSVTLRPATAGSYAGIVIYQDRQCTTADFARIRDTGARNITGTIYVPTAELRVGDAASVTWNAQFVAFQYEGSATDVNLTFAPATSAGSRVPALVE
ncbi:MAG TPA: pilus assembly protein TadG-related protein [Candidatus Limnocylindria bacterium]|nr:pilus assembly protein TadG-related protein [Candidatus Limnocylindria bacterium]